MYRYLASVIRDPSAEHTLKALAVDAYAVDFVPFDHRFLHELKVLPSLWTLAHEGDTLDVSGAEGISS